MYAEALSWLTGPNISAAAYNFYSGTLPGIPFESIDFSLLNAQVAGEYEGTYPLLACGNVINSSGASLCDNMFATVSPRDLTPPTYSLSYAFQLFGRYFSRDPSVVSTIRGLLNPDSQAIPRDRTPGEIACTPTAGMCVELVPGDGLTTNVVGYSSVASYEDDKISVRQTNYSGLAVSTNSGVTWSKPSRTKRFNTSDYDDPWQALSFARSSYTDRYLYVFGTPNGRTGGARISRVEQSRILDISAYPSPYSYWNGSSWSTSIDDAVDVIPGDVYQLSVMWHVASAQWLAMYLDVASGSLNVRTSANPWGPWSDENPVATPMDFSLINGCYFFTRSRLMSAPLFALGQVDLYNVRLMRLNL